MGTLFSQSVRAWFDIDRDLIDKWCGYVDYAVTKHGLSEQNALKMLEIMVMDRSNNMAKWDGDAKDEQLAGFGELWMETNKLLGEYLEND